MVADFRQVGTADCSNEWLKMVVNTSANWSAQALRILLLTPSGLAAFVLTLCRMDLTWCWSSWMALYFPGRAGCVSASIRRSKREKKWLRESGSVWSVELVVLPCHMLPELLLLKCSCMCLTDASPQASPCLLLDLQNPVSWARSSPCCWTTVSGWGAL